MKVQRSQGSGFYYLAVHEGRAVREAEGARGLRYLIDYKGI